MSARMERIVVVGAGLAALSAAERLRERGFSGDIVIIGDETHRPYNRTPLSKGLLTGQVSTRELPLRSYTPLNVQWKLGNRVTGLDIARRMLRTEQGADIGFDGLIIATGVRARHLPGAPMDAPHVWTLRTLDDARAIDRAMTHARRIAVVGGGFLGCEIASTARERGIAVTLIDRSPTVLHRSLGAPIGAVIGEMHRAAGVRLHLGVGVSGWAETRRGAGLTLDDNEKIDADLVVIGVGTDPNTEWLHNSGLDITNGVLCDETGHALTHAGTRVEGIVAAGDVARWPNQRFDSIPRRVEHWINAVEMGQAAADSLLAGPAASPFCPTPRFWSHQHGTRIQASGQLALGTSMTLLDGNFQDRRFIAGFTRPSDTGPTLVGVVAVNMPRSLLRWHESIGRPANERPSRARPVTVLQN
ncbi:pyridine nucleotide-disulfide oxidoreductase [Cryobacterium algoritolerans]|uniref:Pyridine nucleotide-disulfide oxidoreductase n=1 Tax=Cryobacterium algoritolerans TaxID=1259184 RepID=A0A4R8WUZ2_9MICO|nr:FAD-dependent oxidoreductase [Cryobacterium algoritolerans]TFC15193.1 pyridine nucleotide-disulfide oxidoreductase [Cryobacterium algoritolerans]